MIVVDSSVLIAVALGEPEQLAFVQRVEAEGASALSSVNYVEASNVLEGRLGLPGRSLFEVSLKRFADVGLRVVGFDHAMADLARDGFRRFGKGRHPARLNLGDCFAYALAKALDAPLLYKGSDFDKTDVKRA